MSDKSAIEWTDATWNPIVGCSVLTPGCTNCYAMKLAGRRLKNTPKYKGLTTPSKAGPVWNGKVRLWESALLDPLHWRQPKKIFVNSEGDLFHESIPDEWIDRVFAVMALCPQHTFQVLTKRAARMRNYLIGDWAHRVYQSATRLPGYALGIINIIEGSLSNVWLGVSTERQDEADERVPLLMQTPAAVRFISAEPLLGPIDLRKIKSCGWVGAGPVETDIFSVRINRERGLHWVIVGGESGANARPMQKQWASDLRDQCAASGVPFFFKQWGEWAPRWPGDRVDGMKLERVGKKRAGRLLDGKEHNEFPVTQAKAEAA